MALSIIFYLPRPAEKGQDLLKALVPFVMEGRLEVLSSLEAFAARLHKPKDSSSVMIIWDPTSDELRQIGDMRDLLTGVRTLLVLPDQETETVFLAHKIMPSYISYTDLGVSGIVSVLGRIAGTGGNGSSSVPPS
jgi:hypothetical protein